MSLTQVELTSTTTRAESISTKYGIVQQESACSRLALAALEGEGRMRMASGQIQQKIHWGLHSKTA